MFVRDLNPSVTEDQIREAFSQFGVVSSVTVENDPASGGSKGVAHVEMLDAQEGYTARRALHNT
jgi:RNA recognition motif-containing protein